MPMNGDVRYTHANISLAARELGYRPSTDLETGLKKFTKCLHWRLFSSSIQVFNPSIDRSLLQLILLQLSSPSSPPVVDLKMAAQSSIIQLPNSVFSSSAAASSNEMRFRVYTSPKVEVRVKKRLVVSPSALAMDRGGEGDGKINSAVNELARKIF
ncbi:hypothetical protein QQ045_000107 [Rhodiola kirilowii]